MKILINKLEKIKIPRKLKLKACPFCGGKAIHCWMEYPETESPKYFHYKSKGRASSLTCGDCGIGVEFGYFGSGINNNRMLKIMGEHWNRRAKC